MTLNDTQINNLKSLGFSEYQIFVLSKQLHMYRKLRNLMKLRSVKTSLERDYATSSLWTHAYMKWQIKECKQ